MQYRKKPVVIKAFQTDERFSPIASHVQWPQWLLDAWVSGTLWQNAAGDFYVKTLEGDMKITLGDWIIQGVQGELYPCKEDIFAQTYEPVEEGEV